MIYVLALILALAAACDIRTHRIPNSLIAVGLAAGLGVNVWQNGSSGLLLSLLGIATALPALLAYAISALGAGDVKLLMVVGALMGPGFLLWTLLGTVLAGGVLALAWATRRGVLRETVQNAQFGMFLLGTHAGISALVSVSKAGLMPFAPAIALGAVFAIIHLYLRVL